MCQCYTFALAFLRNLFLVFQGGYNNSLVIHSGYSCVPYGSTSEYLEPFSLSVSKEGKEERKRK
jgi:hypothetical protein